MIGLDISSSSVKLVELGQTARQVGARALRHRAASRRAGSPTARSRSSTRSPKPCAAWSPRAAPGPRNVVHGDAAVGRDHQEDHAARRPARGGAGDPGRVRSQPVHPVLARRGEPRLLRHRPEPHLGRRRRSADRRLAQGTRAGPPGPGRSRRPEAGHARHRVVRLAPGDGPRRSPACPSRARTRWSRCSRSAPTPPACRCCATTRCCTTATRPSAARSSRS